MHKMQIKKKRSKLPMTLNYSHDTMRSLISAHIMLIIINKSIYSSVKNPFGIVFILNFVSRNGFWRMTPPCIAGISKVLRKVIYLTAVLFPMLLIVLRY